MAIDAETKPSRSVQSRYAQLRLALPPPRRPSVRHPTRQRKAEQSPSVRVEVAVAPLGREHSQQQWG